MYINEETAQLILDAIAFTERQWSDASKPVIVEEAREDFVAFCEYRGIEGVEVTHRADR